MAATIFAISGVPAPEAIDGKNLLPLLTDPAGQVREFLPLFNLSHTLRPPDSRDAKTAAAQCNHGQGIGQ